MRSPELIQRIQDSMTLLIESSDELRDLDQVLGDGDLGITISAGARAVIEALKAMPTEPEPAPSDVARACAKAFANANPSTMAALVAGGLLAGSKVWVGCEDVTAVEAEAFIRAAASSISHRGKSQVGDKTILDAMIPAVDSLARSIEANPAVASDSALASSALDSAIRGGLFDNLGGGGLLFVGVGSRVVNPTSLFGRASRRCFMFANKHR